MPESPMLIAECFASFLFFFLFPPPLPSPSFLLPFFLSFSLLSLAEVSGKEVPSVHGLFSCLCVHIVFFFVCPIIWLESRVLWWRHWLKTMDPGVPASVGWVKNPTTVAQVVAKAQVWFPASTVSSRIWHCHSWHKSQLWLRFFPWPENVYMP